MTIVVDDRRWIARARISGPLIADARVSAESSVGVVEKVGSTKASAVNQATNAIRGIEREVLVRRLRIHSIR